MVFLMAYEILNFLLSKEKVYIRENILIYNMNTSAFNTNVGMKYDF